MSHFINLDLSRLMQVESYEINDLKKSPTYIVNDHVSYFINRKSSTVSILEKAIEKSESFIFNVLSDDLVSIKWNEHIGHLNQLAHRQKKVCFVHSKPETHTLEIDKLLERLNSKSSIVQCGNEDLEVASALAERVQYIQLNEYSQSLFDSLFTNSSSVVGFLIAKDEFAMHELRELKNKLWSDYSLNMVSLGCTLDTTLDHPWELCLFNFSGNSSSFSNVVEVEDDYIFLNEVDSTLLTCAASQRKGADKCLFPTERLDHSQIYTSTRDGKGYCASCIEILD